MTKKDSEFWKRWTTMAVERGTLEALKVQAERYGVSPGLMISLLLGSADRSLVDELYLDWRKRQLEASA